VSWPTLVRTEVRESYVDMAGGVHTRYVDAHRASVLGLLAAFLADQGACCECDAVAAALLEQFVVVPRTDR